MFPIIQRKFIFPMIELIRREPISRCLSELNKSQWYSYEQLRELQWRKLKILLNHCYRNIPFYKITFDKLKLKPEDIKNFDDFRQLPLLTKNNLRCDQEELRDKNFKNRVEHSHSGGTLGKPLSFIRDSLSSAYARAAQLRGLGWYGIKKGDKQLRIWGMPFDDKKAKKERRKDFILNRLRISPFEISKKIVLQYFKIINKFKPKYIYGYVSAIFKICQLMKEQKLNGDELNIRYVVTTAETLYPHQKRYIEDFFNCRVINEYGCSEMGPIAFECPKGNLHISMENILAEFIKHDAYREKNAEIILTNLNSFSMPMLRYKIDDTGQSLKMECPCGKGLAIMNFDAGRVISTLVATNGHFISGSTFYYIAFDVIEKYKGIKDFRVVQKQKNKIEITLSKDKNFNNNILSLFTSKIKELLGTDMMIEYMFKNEIPLEKSGKRLIIYSELKDVD